MNGEMYQLIRLVSYIKEAMQTGSEKEFKLGKYESRILFSFLPKKNLLFSHDEKCDDVLSWYKGLKKREIKDINLINYFETNDIKLAGFSNAARQGIVTTYADGNKTFWAAKWEFDDTVKLWTVYYKEFEWTESQDGAFYFPECRKDFERTLLDIEKLAHTLGFNGFANIFRGAYDTLTGKNNPTAPEWAKDTMPNFKGESLKLFLAASAADVFGAMGSWNDSPYGVAFKKGLGEEYDRLSHDLYVSIKKAVMNAVNGFGDEK